MSSGNFGSWLSDQANILHNFAANMAPVERLLSGTAYLIGISFAVKAIYTLKAYGESKTMMSSSSNIKEPLIYFIVAGVLIYFPTGLSLVLNTTFGSSSILEYSSLNVQGGWLGDIFGPGSDVGRSLTMIIKIVGIASFIRGWVLIARAAGHGQQPGATGKGLMHIVGGILAVNIVGTLNLINNTLFS